MFVCVCVFHLLHTHPHPPVQEPHRVVADGIVFVQNRDICGAARETQPAGTTAAAAALADAPIPAGVGISEV